MRCTYAHARLVFTAVCRVVVVVAVGPGAPPDGHVSGARLLSAGSPAAHEEEPGKKIRKASDSN